MADPGDLDALVSELKAVVEQRRRSGDYPPDLAEQLDSEFAKSRALERFDFEPVRRTLSHLDAASHFSLEHISSESNVPGGSAAHRAANAAMKRPIQGVLQQMQDFADSVREVLRQIAAVVEDPRSHEHSDLRGDIDMLLLRLTEAEQTLRRVRQSPEVAGAGATQPVDIDWEDFTARFRGDEIALLASYEELLDRLVTKGPVLDIGCGDGMLLTALGSRGVEARGVDTDAGMVAAATRRGLDVIEQDASLALATAPERSLGAVLLMQVVEHLTAAELPQVVRAARLALRDGGLLAMETPNSDSLFVHSHSFWLDPTHVRLVPPAYLAFLLERSGFREVEVHYRSPVPDDQRLDEVPADIPGAEVLNRNIGRLNSVIFAPQDVLVIGVA